MPIGLSKVAVQLPGRSEPVQDILLRAGRDAMERKMFAKVHGLRESPTLADHEQLEDLFVAAGRAALDGGTAGLVLYGHTMLTQEFGLSRNTVIKAISALEADGLVVTRQGRGTFVTRR